MQTLTVIICKVLFLIIFRTTDHNTRKCKPYMTELTVCTATCCVSLISVNVCACLVFWCNKLQPKYRGPENDSNFSFRLMNSTKFQRVNTPCTSKFRGSPHAEHKFDWDEFWFQCVKDAQSGRHWEPWQFFYFLIFRQSIDF